MSAQSVMLRASYWTHVILLTAPVLTKTDPLSVNVQLPGCQMLMVWDAQVGNNNVEEPNLTVWLRLLTAIFSTSLEICGVVQQSACNITNACDITNIGGITNVYDD